MAQCATTALVGAVPRPRVRGARGRFGGFGRYLVLCLSLFPLPAPRVPRCVWRAIPSGFPLPSLTGKPFHAVCAFRELGPVALLVVPACTLRVCVLALPRRPLPPPTVVWRAHLARSRHWALVGPFHVVRAPPCLLPRSLALSGVLGGGRPGPGSPLPGLQLCAPRGAGPWRMPCGGCVPRGWRGAVPGGGGLQPLRGASGVRRCPSPCRPSSGAGGRGPATRVSRLRSVRAWGPSTGPTVCALVGRRCSLWGWRKGVPGGVPSTVVRGVWGGALPLPRLPAHWAGCPGPLPTCCGRGRVGVGAKHCPLGLHALWGLRSAGVVGGSPRGGVACHCFEGRLVSGAVPPPTARPLGRSAGVPRPVCSGCGQCGRGDPSPVPQRAPLRAGVARSGRGGRASPGGLPSTVVRGV